MAVVLQKLAQSGQAMWLLFTTMLPEMPFPLVALTVDRSPGMNAAKRSGGDLILSRGSRCQKCRLFMLESTTTIIQTVSSCY